MNTLEFWAERKDNRIDNIGNALIVLAAFITYDDGVSWCAAFLVLASFVLAGISVFAEVELESRTPKETP